MTLVMCVPKLPTHYVVSILRKISTIFFKVNITLQFTMFIAKDNYSRNLRCETSYPNSAPEVARKAKKHIF